ncbi:MAG: sodium:solute symporter family protein [Eubacterium sp.]|nr:sodium:solute symporter family protein [Eubacterium sp.]
MLSRNIVWIAFVCYIIFLIVVAAVGKRIQHHKDTNAQEFATGGGTIRWPFLVMTYIASLMSTWVFFAGPGAYYRGGFGYWASELSYICMFPIIVHFVMNKVWIVNSRRKYTTPADLFYDRFRSPVLRVILALIFLASSFPYVTSVLIAISQAATIVSGGAINYKSILIIIGIVIVGYVMIGGMKSIVMTDTVQGLVYIGILVAIVLVCLGIGFHGSLPAAVSSVWENTNDWFSYPGPDAWVPYSARLGYPLSCMIGWTIMLPHVFVRSGFSGASPKTQRRLMFMTPILQVIVWSSCMLIGLIAIALLPGLGTAETEYIIPYLIQNIIHGIHPILGVVLMVGFFIGAVAVGVTTADSFLLVSGTILTQDILVNTFKLKLKENQKLIATRAVIAIIGVASIIMALDPPDLIFTLIMFAIAIVTPLFAVLVIGLYWKKATKQAAIVASVVGTVLVLMTYFVWNVGGLWYGTFGLIGSTICMIVVSLITKQPEADSAEFFEALGDGIMDYEQD